MASREVEIIIELVDKFSQSAKKIEASMSKLAKTSKGSKKSIEDTANSQVAANKRVSASFVSLEKRMVAVFGVYQAKQLVKNLALTSDAWKNIGSKIRVVIDESESYEAVQEKLVKVALASRTSLEATASIYQRIAASQAGLNLSTDETVRIVETINKSLVLYGASANEAQAATVQLSQAFASGVLRGDEFRSISESGQGVLKIFADHLKLSTGELRNFAYEGKLTSDVMRTALIGATEKVDKAFQKIDVTFSTATENLRTNWIKFVGELDKSYGVSANLSQVIVDLSKNLDEVAKYATIAGEVLVSAYAVKGVKAVAALTSEIKLAIAAQTSMNAAVLGSSAAATKGASKFAALGASLKGIGWSAVAFGVLQLGQRIWVLTANTKELTEKTKEVPKWFVEWSKAQRETTQAIEDGNVAIEKTIPSLNDIEKSTGFVVNNYATLNDLLEKGLILYKETTNEYINAAKETEYYAKQVEKVAASTKKMNEEAAKVDSLAEMYKKNFGETMPLALAATDESMQEVMGTINELNRLGRISEDQTKALVLITTESAAAYAKAAEEIEKVEEAFTITSDAIDIQQIKFYELRGELSLLNEAYKKGKIDAEEYANASEKIITATRNYVDHLEQLIETEGYSVEVAAKVKDAYDSGAISLNKYTELTRALTNALQAEADAEKQAAQAAKGFADETGRAVDMNELLIRSINNLSDNALVNLKVKLQEAFEAGLLSASQLKDKIDEIDVALENVSTSGKVYLDSLSAALYQVGKEAGLTGDTLNEFVERHIPAMWDAWRRGHGSIDRLLENLRRAAEFLVNPFDWDAWKDNNKPPEGPGYTPPGGIGTSDSEISSLLTNIDAKLATQIEGQAVPLEPVRIHPDDLAIIIDRPLELKVNLDGQEIATAINPHLMVLKEYAL